MLALALFVTRRGTGSNFKLEQRGRAAIHRLILLALIANQRAAIGAFMSAGENSQEMTLRPRRTNRKGVFVMQIRASKRFGGIVAMSAALLELSSGDIVS